MLIIISSICIFIILLFFVKILIVFVNRLFSLYIIDINYKLCTYLVYELHGRHVLIHRLLIFKRLKILN